MNCDVPNGTVHNSIKKKKKKEKKEPFSAWYLAMEVWMNSWTKKQVILRALGLLQGL